MLPPVGPQTARLQALRQASPGLDCPRDEVELTSPEPDPPYSRKARLAAGVGLALTAVGLAAPLLIPQPPEVVQCLDGHQVRIENPSLLQSLLQKDELSPRGQAVLACSRVSSPAELQAPGPRAALAWEGLVASMGEGLKEERHGGKATVWPYGQAMAASLDQARLSGDYSSFDRMVDGLERYRHDEGGYGPNVGGRGDRFFDDNAWLGLVFSQAHAQRPGHPEYLRKAASLFAFLETGIQPQGGILWKENVARPSFNTCAQGPTIELAARLYEATGDPHYLEVAQRMDRFTDRYLRLPGGLYADNIGTDLRQRDDNLYSYNQGTPVGAKLLLHRLTGDPAYREQALETARAALRHYGEGDRLWREAPAFNAVFLRNLMSLQDPQVDQMLSAYLDRAWQTALAPNGLFSRQAGLGSYDGPELQMIDQAGLVQLYALSAWPRQDLGLIA